MNINVAAMRLFVSYLIESQVVFQPTDVTAELRLAAWRTG